MGIKEGSESQRWLAESTIRHGEKGTLDVRKGKTRLYYSEGKNATWGVGIKEGRHGLSFLTSSVPFFFHHVEPLCFQQAKGDFRYLP